LHSVEVCDLDHSALGVVYDEFAVGIDDDFGFGINVKREFDIREVSWGILGKGACVEAETRKG